MFFYYIKTSITSSFKGQKQQTERQWGKVRRCGRRWCQFAARKKLTTWKRLVFLLLRWWWGIDSMLIKRQLLAKWAQFNPAYLQPHVEWNAILLVICMPNKSYLLVFLTWQRKRDFIDGSWIFCFFTQPYTVAWWKGTLAFDHWTWQAIPCCLALPISSAPNVHAWETPLAHLWP